MSITIDDLTNKIREIAADNPDFIYEAPACEDPDMGSEDCQYVHRDDDLEPIEGEGCIVGRALTQLGVKLNYGDEGEAAYALIAKMVGDGRIDANLDDLEAIAWANDVQRNQDTRFPWGRAITVADEHSQVKGFPLYGDHLKDLIEEGLERRAQAEEPLDKMVQV